MLVKSLRSGQPISDAYIAAKQVIDSRAKDNLQYHSSFGFGIGTQFKEDLLQINAKNNKTVEPGMVFHCRITLTGVSKETSRSVVGIGDTVYIGQDGSAVVLTSAIQKRYNDISYSLDDDEQDQPAKPEPKQAKPA